MDPVLSHSIQCTHFNSSMSGSPFLLQTFAISLKSGSSAQTQLFNSVREICCPQVTKRALIGSCTSVFTNCGKVDFGSAADCFWRSGIATATFKHASVLCNEICHRNTVLNLCSIAQAHFFAISPISWR